MSYCSLCNDVILNESKDIKNWDLGNSARCEANKQDRIPTKNLPDLLEDTRLANSANNRCDENSPYMITPAILLSLDDERGHDSPICESCADLVRSELNEQIEDLEYDIEKYQAFLNNADKQIKEREEAFLQPDKTSVEELSAELERLTREYHDVVAEVEQSNATLAKLKSEEKKALEDRNYLRQQLRLAQESALVAAKEEEEKREIVESIEKLNVFNFVFNISFDDNGITVINGCRLGRLPAVSVDWHEINVALGYVALMMSSIANAIEMKFERYSVFPLGNASYIKEEVASKEPKILPLYYSSRKIALWTTSFDRALVALLNCFQQFMTKLLSYDNQFKFPYRIHSNSLVDSSDSYFSIRYNGNKDELWTKAFRLLLTNFKWAFAWLTVHRKV